MSTTSERLVFSDFLVFLDENCAIDEREYFGVSLFFIFLVVDVCYSSGH